MRGQPGILVRVIGAEMGSSALGSRQRARRISLVRRCGLGVAARARPRRGRARRPPRARGGCRSRRSRRRGTGGASSRPGPGSSTAARAARRPKTRHSSNEFDASRFAPWTPVQGAFAGGVQPGHSVRPSRSVTRRPSCSGPRAPPERLDSRVEPASLSPRSGREAIRRRGEDRGRRARAPTRARRHRAGRARR